MTVGEYAGLPAALAEVVSPTAALGARALATTLIAVPEPAPDRWPVRLALTALVLAVAVLGALGMRRGWRRRAARYDDLPPLPAAPADPGVDRLPPAAGLYVGTTVAGDWLERVVAAGLADRSAGRLRLSDAGVLIERAGANVLFLPAQAVTGARVDNALAGKVIGPGGLLVVSWSHGGRGLDTGFRADDHRLHPVWAGAVAELVAAGSR